MVDEQTLAAKLLSITDHFGKLSVDAGRMLLRHTVQLFPTSELGKPDPICSAILVRYNDHRFLVSAAHFLKDFDANSVAVFVKNELNIPIGTATYADPRKSKTNDQTDIIVWNLSDQVANDLAQVYEFVDLTDASFNHLKVNKPQYLIVGYPNSKTKRNPTTHKIRSEPFIYLAAQSPPKYYKRFGFHASRNLLVDYERKKTKNYTTGSVNYGPWPEGLSGCGIWFLPNPVAVRMEDIHPILVGIFIEYRSEANVVVSTMMITVKKIFERALLVK